MDNKIKVLFFSKLPAFFNAIESLFEEENNFSYQGVSKLDELNCTRWSSLDAIVAFDLSHSLTDLDTILKKRGNAFSSLSFIFIVDSEKAKNYIRKRNFVSYEVLMKPFRVDQLFNKIKIIAGIPKIFNESPLILNGNYFDRKKNKLTNMNGDVIKLTEKETKIIDYLYTERGKILSKEVLLKSVWGYDRKISTHTLETHIYRLRKKIEQGLGETDLILKNNMGYYINPSKASSPN